MFTFHNRIAHANKWHLINVSLESSSLEVPFTMVGKKAIAGPHLSYSFWPPHNEIKNELIQKNISLISKELNHLFTDWEIRLPMLQENIDEKKTASWLLLDAVFFSSNLKSKLNRAMKQGFTHLIGGREIIPEFWRVYAKRLHSLGSLPLPFSFFDEIFESKSNDYEIFLLFHNGVVIGSAANLIAAGFYENVWFAVDKQFQKKYASYYLHWQMIQSAKQLGSSVYSFGRSTTNSGVHSFKKQWGTKDVPLLWLKNKEQNRLHLIQPFAAKIIPFLPFKIVAWLGKIVAKHVY